MAEVNASWYDLVVRLHENGAVSEVVEERINGRLDVETVQPKRKHTSFSFAFCVKVVDLKLIFLGERVKPWMGVEEICDERQIELRVSSDQGCWSQEFTAIEFLGVLKDLLGPL